jgi:hypothetical protein
MPQPGPVDPGGVGLPSRPAPLVGADVVLGQSRHGLVTGASGERRWPFDPWVALVPGLDPTVMGWKQREWYLGEHAAVLFDRNGNAGPTVWANGRAVGGWTHADDGEVRVELLERVDARTRTAIDAERERLRSWLSDVRIKPRFRTAVERALSDRSQHDMAGEG